ncbi:hypothetical protein [Gracilibacillus saliphilus]|uniref:hypothetical protein n=1 Tax=Gracilibacillus saliphilus TaxID=543890 RepID=UPI0013D85CD4|nr:hypothetical protein [Gracilibacillus saliphilus]
MKLAPIEEVKEITKNDRKNLSIHEVEPSEKYKTGKAKRLYPRQCYENAFRYVADKGNLEGIKLVHGLYKPKDINNHCGHAWVELPKNIIFDGVLQRFYHKDGYYSYYQAIKQNEYDCKQMYDIGFKAGGHFGPWN